jgi:putative transposase
MARTARLAVSGYPHHLIHRGNNRQRVFMDQEDRARYLVMLRQVLREQNVGLHAYVLMENHVHLLVTPGEGRALSRLMQRLGTWYAGWFNHRHGRSGSLWEGRFRSSLVETDAYLLVCMRYIENNPVRSGQVERAEDFQWSSARHHVGGLADPLITDHSLYWSLGNTPFEREAAYRKFLSEGVPDESQSLSRSFLGGRTLGSPAFLEQMSQGAGRPLVPRKRGRPFKTNPSPIN